LGWFCGLERPEEALFGDLRGAASLPLASPGLAEIEVWRFLNAGPGRLGVAAATATKVPALTAAADPRRDVRRRGGGVGFSWPVLELRRHRDVTPAAVGARPGKRCSVADIHTQGVLIDR
jgi:hypothetical protein